MHKGSCGAKGPCASSLPGKLGFRDYQECAAAYSENRKIHGLKSAISCHQSLELCDIEAFATMVSKPNWAKVSCRAELFGAFTALPMKTEPFSQCDHIEYLQSPRALAQVSGPNR